MARICLIASAAFLLISLTSPFAAHGEESATVPSPEGFIPGFEVDRLAWSQIERIELIEGTFRETDAYGKKKTDHISSVSVYRFAEGDSRPFTAKTDPLAKPLPEDWQVDLRPLAA